MTDNSEFSVIDRLFRPLAGLTSEARGLRDDVAVLPSDNTHDLVVTTDAMVEGVHFLSTDPLDKVAQKLLRVNLSDLAAKGAKPYGYQLLTAWPRSLPFEAKQTFAKGLKADQAQFNVALFGGDTVSTPGPLMVSVTLFGHIAKGQTVARAGVKAGDRLLVSGPIGQGYLGLKVLMGEYPQLAAEFKSELVDAYQLPQPRLDMADVVRGNAHASMDVSDGLVADAAHIAQASRVDIHIDLNRVPTSRAARAAMALGASVLDLISGGDDYQILCTASGERAKALCEAGFVDIGECYPARSQGQVTVLSDGKPVEMENTGWVHS
ncbi:thiamine-phosphate kinase [Asticcacaulis sp. SL142]|uniref:thiamine-phosphate kinase n=1 Tax=Asticcacaulis sp. SL142 TaxID=2995155 RepID=UPI00226C912B|nr:thiamine-phosphate kinase [Asticcacaulis sp. SL142]WAC48805.1 thiamine-phosphate kinase [Asticcacaulis sp. SL142]